MLLAADYWAVIWGRCRSSREATYWRYCCCWSRGVTHRISVCRNSRGTTYWQYCCVGVGDQHIVLLFVALVGERRIDDIVVARVGERRIVDVVCRRSRGATVVDIVGCDISCCPETAKKVFLLWFQLYYVVNIIVMSFDDVIVYAYLLGGCFCWTRYRTSDETW